MQAERSRKRGPLRCAFVVCALALAHVAAAAGPDAFPVPSTGDLHFDLDQTTFYRADTMAHVEFHLRIANAELKFLPAEGGVYEAQVQVALEAESASGGKTTYARTLSMLVNGEDAAASRDQVQLLTAPLSLPAGEFKVKLTLTDKRAAKRGLLDAVRKRLRSGTATARLTVSTPPTAGELRSSTLQFAWIVIPSTDSMGAPRIVSNPPRLYGLYASTLHAYLEVYDRIDTTGATYELASSIVATAGDTLWTAVDSTFARGAAFSRVIDVDVSSLPAGHYTLVVEARRLNGTAAARTAGGFDVLWQDASWGALDQDQLDLARFLLAENEYDRFRTLTSGEREKYLTEFWARNDPTPETAFNERRAEFERRVRFANTHYGVIGKGILTDRGRIYVRLGEPDDINRHSQPINRETIHEELAQTRGGQELLRTDVPETMETERNKPFEVWTYDRGGHPLFQGAVGSQQSGFGQTFVFVDEQGWGDYILRFTTERTKY